MSEPDGNVPAEFFSGSSNPRFWVGMIVVAVGLSTIPFMVKKSVEERPVIAAIAVLAAVGIAFLSGIGYADRVRYLGRRRRILPPDSGER